MKGLRHGLGSRLSSVTHQEYSISAEDSPVVVGLLRTRMLLGQDGHMLVLIEP